MPKDKHGNEYESKSEFKCPKCGNTEFHVVRTCNTTYPMKAVMFKNLNVHGCNYAEFIELDIDKTKDIEVDEDETLPVCSKCDFELDYDVDKQANID